MRSPANERARRKYNASPKGRAAHAADERRRRARTPVNSRDESDRKMARKYGGFTPEDWARLYERQAGRCPGCELPLIFDRFTHVDHDHTTGRVRGLLCHHCNLALGNVRENPSTLSRLGAYLCRS